MDSEHEIALSLIKGYVQVQKIGECGTYWTKNNLVEK